MTKRTEKLINYIETNKITINELLSFIKRTPKSRDIEKTKKISISFNDDELADIIKHFSEDTKLKELRQDYFIGMIERTIKYEKAAISLIENTIWKLTKPDNMVKFIFQKANNPFDILNAFNKNKQIILTNENIIVELLESRTNADISWLIDNGFIKIIDDFFIMLANRSIPLALRYINKIENNEDLLVKLYERTNDARFLPSVARDVFIF